MLGRTPEVAYQCMRHLEPFLPFRDASPAAPCFNLTVLSTIKASHQACKLSFDLQGGYSMSRGIWKSAILFALQGLAKAQTHGLLNMQTFDISDYEMYEKVENGDSTWILPGVLRPLTPKLGLPC